MVTRFRIGRCVFAAIALVIMCFGFATPAMADPEDAYQPGNAMLTAVIVAPAGTNASEDEYVFHFAGGGTVEEVPGTSISGEPEVKIYSDGVEQDGTTLKKNDIVPTIPDVILSGRNLTSENSLSSGQTYQMVLQRSISDIFSSAAFPHAGVYTYVVTEKSATTALTDGSYIKASFAKYKVRIRVKNSKTGNSSQLGNKGLEIESITVEQTMDDNGATIGKKVDPTYPTVDDSGKIDKIAQPTANNPGTPASGKLAGDEDGCNVPGFTFANKYIVGESFQENSFKVKKLYDGAHSDRTKYSFVELDIMKPNSAEQGSCLTYQIEGEGVDHTTSNLEGGQRLKLDGVSNIDQVNDYMVVFGDDGYVHIKADLKEDSVIRITGEFGPVNSGTRETLSESGLIAGQKYYVFEKNPGDYRPKGYVYSGANSVDPRVNADGMTVVNNNGNDSPPDGFGVYGLQIEGSATGSATTVFVVNTIDEDKVSVTGILINNLPYILMIGIPVIVFIALFVLKRRRNAVE